MSVLDARRRFPIMDDQQYRDPSTGALGRHPRRIRSIPWSIIEPHERQAKGNHGGQNLVRLAERGGLSLCEAVAVIENRRWRAMGDEEAREKLRVLAEGDTE